MKLSSGRQRTLGGLASRALGWSFFNTAFSRLGTLGIGIVLARLLGPHAFGTYAVAMVALVAVLSFNELGVSLAIVRWQGEPEEIAPTVATISLATSCVIYAGCFFAAPAFARSMGAPAAAQVIRVLALNVVVDGVVSTPVAMMQRYFRQDRKMIADQVNNWLGAAVSVWLAWKGYGAMSLAVGRMTGAVVSGVLFILLSPQPLRFGFDPAKARTLLRFGTPLAGASLVVFAISNADQLVVGHVLGATALGFYALAFNLASWPVNMFSVPVRSVAPAVFSRLQHDRSAMTASFQTTTGLLGSATIPVCLVIGGVAVPLVHFVYGARWLPAAQPLMWLSAFAAFRILFELVYDYFVVLARSRVVFTVQLVWLIVLVPALIGGTRVYGIAGAGMAEVAVAALLVTPWYLGELRNVGIRLRAVAARLWLPVCAAVAVGAATDAASRVIPNDFVACALGGLAALGVTALLLSRQRRALALLRPALGARQQVPTSSASPSPSAPSDARPSASTRQDAKANLVTHSPDPAAQAAGLKQLLAVAIPVPAYYDDITAPQRAIRDPDEWLPVYRQAVAARSWDPAGPGKTGTGDRPAGPATPEDADTGQEVGVKS